MAGGSVSKARGEADFFQASPLLEYSDVRVPGAPSARGVFVRASNKSPFVVKDVAKELASLDPFADKAKEAEREKENLQYQRKMARYRQEHQMDLQWELKNRHLDFDPKQGGEYYTRFTHIDLRNFDLDEESSLGPMRFTNAVYKDKDDYELCEAVNIFSVKIGCSDVGFPIHVYGTLIARDNIDHKCVCLFRNDRDHCQIINSEDESLVLTGPKRGLASIGNVYIETDLKIKGHQGQDRELSKGLLTIRGVGISNCSVRSISLATRLSTVDVLYGFMTNAVEGTIAVEVTQGYFDGQITAHTTHIPNRLVLYDRELYGSFYGDNKGLLRLMRPVICVSVNEMLVIVAKTCDGKSERTISFTPWVNGGEEDVISVGHGKMRVKVTWSLMDP